MTGILNRGPTAYERHGDPVAPLQDERLLRKGALVDSHTRASDQLELEQAHALLDEYGIDRIDVDTLMLLSLRGRIELLLDRARESDRIL